MVAPRWLPRLSRHLLQGDPDVCWEWQGYLSTEGYGVCFLGADADPAEGTKPYMYAHRLAWIAEHGSIPRGKSVLHHCDNRPCANPSHLFLGTLNDNNQDMRAKDRQAHGEGIGTSKLTEVAVAEIRALYSTGVWTQRELGALFFVDASNIGQIVRGVTWAHLEAS